MTEWVPLNRQRHQHKYWRPRQDYRHSSGQSLVPVFLGELGQLMSEYALAFTDHEGRYAAIAVLGLGQEEHFYLGPNGQWLGDYVPARLRTHPFQLLRAGEGKHALCIDSMHVSEDASFESMFDDNGDMSASIQEVLGFLQHVEQQDQVTRRACEQLTEKNLIEPWPLTLANEKSKAVEHGNKAEKQTIQGLYRINESALNTLSSDALAELRQSGALALAYAQLLSVPRIQQLAKRAKWQTRLLSHVQQSGALAAGNKQKDMPNELFSESSAGSLNFDDL